MLPYVTVMDVGYDMSPTRTQGPCLGSTPSSYLIGTLTDMETE